MKLLDGRIGRFYEVCFMKTYNTKPCRICAGNDWFTTSHFPLRIYGETDVASGVACSTAPDLGHY